MPDTVAAAGTAPGSAARARGLAPRLPGDPGLWFFIAADTLAFALFFAVFTAGRVTQPALYAASARQLSLPLGLLNTLILLTSGWLMALAVEAARAGSQRAVVRNLVLALVVGSGFAVVKVIEYKTKIDAGITMLSNDFFMYYYAFTGVHFLHFAIGVAALLLLLSMARRGPIDARFRLWIESAASYWHMVDLLWILLFPLLYLQR